jgi:hypothetical protein
VGGRKPVLSAKWDVLFTAVVFLVGCGGEEPDRDSRIALPDSGSGGQSGSPDFIFDEPTGGSAPGGTGGSGGSSSGLVLHQCPTTPDPPCPARTFSGSFDTRNGSLAELQGVTEISGTLTIRDLVGMEALSCLEHAGNDVTIDLFSGEAPESLWGLRNLRVVGGTLDIQPGSQDVHLDCAFRRLESVGSRYLTGGAVDVRGRLVGELDLSRVTEVTHIRIRSSKLTRITLPSNVTLTMGQLFLENNAALTDVLGFSNVTLERTGIVVSGAYSLRIVDNALLSTCRAVQFQQIFLNAGFGETTMEISGNAPDCSP